MMIIIELPPGVITLGIILICIFFLLLLALKAISTNSFDDYDEDMYWEDNYAVIKCPHLNKTDRVVHSIVTCEEVHTICDDCGQTLDKRTNC